MKKHKSAISFKQMQPIRPCFLFSDVNLLYGIKAHMNWWKTNPKYILASKKATDIVIRIFQKHHMSYPQKIFERTF